MGREGKASVIWWNSSLGLSFKDNAIIFGELLLITKIETVYFVEF